MTFTPINGLRWYAYYTSYVKIVTHTTRILVQYVYRYDTPNAINQFNLPVKYKNVSCQRSVQYPGGKFKGKSSLFPEYVTPMNPH